MESRTSVQAARFFSLYILCVHLIYKLEIEFEREKHTHSYTRSILQSCVHKKKTQTKSNMSSKY